MMVGNFSGLSLVLAILCCFTEVSCFTARPTKFTSSGRLAVSSSKRMPSLSRKSLGVTPAEGLSLRMSEGDGDKDEEGGLLDKVKKAFTETEKGKGSPVEQNINFVVDLVTVTAGAAVAMCLLFNVMGKVPCI
mmetsp:Transcript_20404/g.31871  ORF Transcript_20404/g.31871 Transcript_20404/m.31871 type:complete len:133 (+) Transcript_20404:280-678(+)